MAANHIDSKLNVEGFLKAEKVRQGQEEEARGVAAAKEEAQRMAAAAREVREKKAAAVLEAAVAELRATFGYVCCKKHHEMSVYQIVGGICDRCDRPVRFGERVLGCRRCDYYYCSTCGTYSYTGELWTIGHRRSLEEKAAARV